MNSTNKFLLGLGCLGLFVVACDNHSNEPTEVTDNTTKTVVSFSADATQTKVAWVDGLDLNWADGDDIGVYDSNGANKQLHEKEVHGKSAKFSGTDIAIGDITIFHPYKAGNTYTIDATGQVQDMGSPYAHLAGYTFLETSTTLQDGQTNVNLHFDPLMAQFKWMITAPEHVAIEKIGGFGLKAASTAFHSSKTYTIAQGVADAGTTVDTDRIDIDITGLTSASTSPVEAYQMVIPTSLSNENLELLIYDTNKEVLAYTNFTGVTMDYVAGKQYELNVSGFTEVSSSPIVWDTDANLTYDTETKSVAAQDGISKIQYLNLNGGNPNDFTVGGPDEDGHYYMEASNMNTNQAWVLECPLYEPASAYTFTLDMKVAKKNQDMVFGLQHSHLADLSDLVNLGTTGLITSWTESTIVNGEAGEIIQSNSTSGNSLEEIHLTELETFHRVTITFNMPAGYDHDMIYLVLDKESRGTNDVSIKIISLVEAS